MKKYLGKVLSLALVLCLLLGAAVYARASATPSFELTSVEGKVGETVEVELIVHNNPGITALSVQIGYSAEDLELLSIENAGLFSDRITTGRLSSNPVSISWYASDSSDDSNSGALAVLKFKIKEGARSSNITISYDEDNVFNSSFDNKYFATVNGSISIDKGSFLGDADGDGTLTSIDVTVIQRYCASMDTGIGEETLLRGDVDGNGALEIIDATFIQRRLADMETPYRIGERF